MAKPLRSQLNQVRAWVRQGRTDAWIAHQLEVTVQQINAFKREHGLEPDADGTAEATGDEVDLRAEDDAQIAAELDAEETRRSIEGHRLILDALGRGDGPAAEAHAREHVDYALAIVLAKVT